MEVKKKKSRKTRVLKKEEKKTLLDMLSNLVFDYSDVVCAVIDSVSKQKHIHVFEERGKLWNSLQSAQSLMFTLVKGLTELFIRVYKSCQTGKDKYCRFQLEWHRQCSLLLRDQVDGGVNKELSQIHQRWLGYCEGSGVAKVVHNPVVIAIYSAVFDYLMQRVAKQQTSEQAECDLLLNKQAEDACGSNVQEEDGVYYRFGGATLAAMLHQRYKQLKFVPESKRVCQSADNGTEGNTVH